MRRSLLGMPFDALTSEETLSRALDAMRTGSPVQHVAINVAKFVKARRDAELRRDIMDSDIVGVDGMGILWAARALGVAVPERVAGIDLMEKLLAACAAQGFRPYFLGATQQVLDHSLAIARGRWPGLVFAGARNGYFAAEEENAVVSAIRESGADCLFIAMPTPQKERFLHRHKHALGVPFIMGVGGSFDVLAGKVERAPPAMRRAGLEWLYRVYQEPRRMWWRYASTNAVFAGLIGKALMQRALAARTPERSYKQGS